MKAMKKKMYVSPETDMKFVELEKGFMESSIFKEEHNHDNGVSIEGHEIGYTGDYSETGWDQPIGGNN